MSFLNNDFPAAMQPTTSAQRSQLLKDGKFDCPICLRPIFDILILQGFRKLSANACTAESFTHSFPPLCQRWCPPQRCANAAAAVNAPVEDPANFYCEYAMALTSCGHIFCHTCITTWLRTCSSRSHNDDDDNDDSDNEIIPFNNDADNESIDLENPTTTNADDNAAINFENPTTNDVAISFENPINNDDSDNSATKYASGSCPICRATFPLLPLPAETIPRYSEIAMVEQMLASYAADPPVAS